MDKLKTILQSEAGHFIFIGIGITLFLSMKRSMVVMLLFILLCAYLYKKSKNLFFVLVTFIGIIIIIGRFRNDVLTESGTIEEEVLVIKNEGNATRIRLNHENYLLYTKTKLTPGDKILVKATFFSFEKLDIEHNFDYETYLLSEDIHGLMYSDNVQIIGHTFSIYEVNERTLDWIDSHYEKPTSSYLKMFILGNKDDMDDDIVTSMNQVSITHLFVLSGMHVALLLSVLRFLLFYLKRNESTTNFILYSMLIFYVVITGVTLSLLRASFQAILLTSSKKWRFYFSKVDLLTFVYLGFLLYQPLLIVQIGFQLSFLITFVILISSSLLKSTNKIGQLIKVQLLATVFSLPILLPLNHQFSLAFLWAGIFFYVLVVYFFLPLSILVLISQVFEPIYLKLIQFFEEVITFFEHPSLFIQFEFPSIDQIMIYYLMILMLMIALMKKKIRLNFLIAMVFTMFILFYLPSEIRSSRVVFFDVGQGDASYIESQGCNVLIDSGSSDNYNHLINYFLGENIDSFDIVFITHFHEDHYGEMVDLLEKIPTSMLFIPYPNELFPNAKVLSKEEKVTCKSSLVFEVLSASTSSENENNNSIVLYTKIENDHYLFTGDIEEMVEDKIDLSDKPVDIIKVPHHGSSTSSSLDFVNQVRAEIAIISVGENTYGHPSEEIIHRYLDLSSKVFRTDQLGTISINYYFHTRIRRIEHYQYQISFYDRRLL